MNKLNVTMLSLGTVALTAPVAMGAGVLVDPGFEDPLVDNGSGVGKWQPFFAAPATSVTTTSNPRTGSSSLELAMNATANLFAGVFQDVSVMAGEEITFAGFHAAVDNSPSGIEIRIEWRDSVGGTEISRTGNLVLSPGTDYEPFSLTDTTPAGADTARVVYAVQSFGGSVDASVNVDDVSVTGIPEPSSTMLAGLSLLGLLATRKR